MKLKKIIISLSLLLILLSIPGFTESDSFSGEFNAIKMIFKLILYIVIFVVIVLLALYGTKFFAKNFSGIANSRYIKIIDTISISANIKFFILEVNSIIYLLAMTNENIELLDKYDLDEFEIIKEKNINEYNNQFEDNNLMKILRNFIDKEDENEKRY